MLFFYQKKKEEKDKKQDMPLEFKAPNTFFIHFK